MGTAPRVVIHQLEEGFFSVLADEGTEVFWIDDTISDGRTFKVFPSRIPDGLIDERFTKPHIELVDKDPKS